MAQGPIQPGEAVVTSAGRLPPPIKWIIHAATMGPDLRTDEDLIGRATASALAAAARIGARSIALPAMGTGAGGFPMDQAAQVMVEEARLAAAEPGTSLERILFVLRNEDARRFFDQAIVCLRRVHVVVGYVELARPDVVVELARLVAIGAHRTRP